MSTIHRLPGYQDIFGQIDFRQGDEARSVYSPAAYLSDLLQLVDDYFQDSDLDVRRPDLKKIVLNKDNTYDLVPYLDIVNELLENLVGNEPAGLAYDQLRQARYPLELPFDLHHERLLRHLHFLKVNPVTLYRLFTGEPSGQCITRLYLGLSEEQWQMAEAVTDETTIKSFFNLKPENPWTTLLPLNSLMKCTGLSASEVLELLYGNLSERATDATGVSERALASGFFIHAGLASAVVLDEDLEVLKPAEGDSSYYLWNVWFERVNRLVRTARALGMSFSELNLILGQCCNNQLNGQEMQKIAIVQYFRQQYELSVEEACALLCPINTQGIGDEDAPADLFNQTFNGKWAKFDKKYIAGSVFTPGAYTKFEKLATTANLSANEGLGKRICCALGFSSNDFEFIVKHFTDRTKDWGHAASNIFQPQNTADHAGLSLFYRISKLVEILETSPADLFNVLDILEKDPAIRSFSNFDVLLHGLPEGATTNLYAVLAHGGFMERAWLLQHLCAITKWCQLNDLSSADLKVILSGERMEPTVKGRRSLLETDKKDATKQYIQERITALDQLYQQFDTVKLSAPMLESTTFSQRTSRILYDNLLKHPTLVSRRNAHLLNDIESDAIQLGQHTVMALAQLTKADFKGLGLSEALLDQLFYQLVFLRYIETDGKLILENFPENAADFALSTDFSNLDSIIFRFLNQLYEMEASAGNNPVELSFFLTDLGNMDYTELEKAEIQKRLIYNGWIDENGMVPDPVFFADPENESYFSLDVNFDALAPKVHAYIQQKRNDFVREKLVLGTDLFEHLPLTPEQMNELLENLRFNQYTDENNNIRDKEAMLALQADDLRITLPFYPCREKIVQAIQQHIEDFQQSYFRLKKENLEEMAEDLVAELLMTELEAGAYTENGALHDAQIGFFLDPDNFDDFQLDLYFTGHYAEAAYRQLSGIAEEVARYRFVHRHVAHLRLSDEAFEQLCSTLQGYGFLSDRFIAPDALEYFLNPNNIIDLDVEGFEDLGEKIFVSLHHIALEVQGAGQAFAQIVQSIAYDQENTVLAGLQDAFGVESDVVQVLCAAILPHQNIVEAFMAPLFASVNATGHMTELPKDQRFNKAWQRIEQFALLCTKLQLSAGEATVIFTDQGLAEKFGENLSLPGGLSKIDALLEHPGGKVLLFAGGKYWAFSTADYQPVEQEQNVPLTKLSPVFTGAGAIDAAFTDREGTAWIICGQDFFFQKKGSATWEKKAGKVWGKVDSDFTKPDKIVAALTNADGQVFLFTGDQYIRYSTANFSTTDEGYPKMADETWMEDMGTGTLPEAFQEGLDALLHGRDDRMYCFKGQQFVNSDDRDTALNIADYWGLAKTNYEGNAVEVAFIHQDRFVMISGNRVLQYTDSLERPNVQLDEGFPKSLANFIPALPEEFEDGVDAGFKEKDGPLYLFKGDRSLRVSADLSKVEEDVRIGERWGVVQNTLQNGQGFVSAALNGLDGCTYIFSGNQFFRYSKDNYAKADEGYPKSIAGNWGGLISVDAAFVMDGKTWLFGPYLASLTDPDSPPTQLLDGYVCYSINDYSKADKDYPKPVNDNWWNLPFSLTEQTGGFATPDATLVAKDGNTYLFSGKRYIFFEKNERWWSEPMPIAEKWAGLPDNFGKIDAAFTGKDDKTYLFFGDQCIRYSGDDFSQADERYPRPTRDLWGKVDNNFQRRETVDAALFMQAKIPVKNATPPTNPTDPIPIEDVEFTFLLSGQQYIRYRNRNYAQVEEGYPKNLKALRNEPRLDKFEFPLEKGFDAGCASDRMVWLFKDTQCYTNADQQHVQYTNLLTQPAKAAFVDNGKLYVDDGTGWKYYADPNAGATAVVPEPSFLREVPEPFRSNLDIVLKGTDGNTYLFKEQQCYNLLLEKSYPLAEEWGRPAINVQLDKGIDAIFEGPDGKIYVFSGDQYQTYTLPRSTEKDAQGKAKIIYILPEYADGYPKRIQDDFGLDNVVLAFVRDGQVYLMERADDLGRQRCCTCQQGNFLKKEHTKTYPVDIYWWGIPDAYIEEGFDAVSAVLFEEDNIFLIHERAFIQYNKAEDHWSYPKPLDRIWRNMPKEEERFENIKTAFGTGDGTQYFFSEKAFVVYQKGTPAPLSNIKDRWGKTKNNIQKDQKIDAAFVFGDNTYLFSGNQYVRYSGMDYEFIDADYPKSVVGNLRKEPGFELLPEAFEKTLKETLEGDLPGRIDEIESDGRSLFFFMGRNLHVFASETAQAGDLKRLGHRRNNLREGGAVDAVWVNAKGHTLLFSGDQYVRYSGRDYRYMDEGYPKQIHPNLAAEEGIPALPAVFHQGVDAGFADKNGVVHLFKKNQYYSSVATANPQEIQSVWGKANNAFLSSDGTPTGPLDALFADANGAAYAFKDGQYARYEDLNNEFADEGFPKQIRDNWGNMPPAFEAGLDAAFVFEGKTYMLKGDRYIRYTDPTFRKVDANFPQRLADRWTGMADYWLTDIKTITDYKSLANQLAGKTYSLADFLSAIDGVDDRPYHVLADIFEAQLADVQWLKRQNAFLPAQAAMEQRFNIELVLRIYEILELCKLTGSAPEEVYKSLWSQWFPKPAAGATQTVTADERAAAEATFKYLGLVNTEADWKILQRQLRDEFNEKKRDALVPFAIFRENGKNNGQSPLANSRDLYGKLLIDVEMDSTVETSRIREAISAVQLYIHRYLVQLETLDIRGQDDLNRRLEIKERWEWLKNYRVWEANRKVFLYPENYIRPELRDDKTSAFKTLEDDLLQGEMSEELVQIAYKKYLDEYTEVSRLTIAGGHVFENTVNRDTHLNLILFGRTKTDPIRYYYRTSTFLNGLTENAVWGAWMPVDIPINANRVYPVFAFGRVFVFWATLEERVKTGNTSQMRIEAKDKVQEVKNETPVDYCLQIYFTFYDLNKKWKAPQLLKVKDDGSINGVRPISIVSTNLPIVDFRLHVESATELRGFEYENIVVSCMYKVEHTIFKGLTKKSPQGFEFPFPVFPILEKEIREVSVSYTFTPEFYVDKVSENSGSVPMIGARHFNAIFPTELMDDKRVVALSNPRASDNKAWFCFDHKGGSFLAKPVLAASVKNVSLLNLRNNPDNLPQWDRMDAAFEVNGTIYYFNNTKKAFVTSKDLNKEIPIARRWGRKRITLQKVDTIFQFSPGFGPDNFVAFTGDAFMLLAQDTPSPLQNNPHGFPQSGPIRAAVRSGDKNLYFMGDNFVSDDNPGMLLPVNDHWKLSSELGAIRGAFVFNGRTYILGEKGFVRYDRPQYGDLPAQPDDHDNKLAHLMHDLGFRFGLLEKLTDRSDSILSVLNKDNMLYFITKEDIYHFSNNDLVTKTALANNRSEEVWGGIRHRFNGKNLNQTSLDRTDLKEDTTLDAEIHHVFGKNADGDVYLLSGAGLLVLSGREIADVAAVAPTDKAENRFKAIAPRLREMLKKANDQRKGATAWFGANGLEYAFFGNVLLILQNGQILETQTFLRPIEAAFAGTDGQLYFFSGTQFITVQNNANARFLTSAIHSWSNAANQAVWGQRPWPNGGSVTAAFEQNGKVFLVKSHEFCAFDSQSRIAEPGFPKPVKELRTFNKRLPADWKTIEGAFFWPGSGNNRVLCLVSNGMIVSTELMPLMDWVLENAGKESELTAVDTAYYAPGKGIYLISGGRSYLHNLDQKGEPEMLVAEGYPLNFPPNALTNIDAALYQDGTTYLFNGARYSALSGAADPGGFIGTQDLRSGWSGLPETLLSGFDAALKRGNELYFFKGSQYAKFEAPFLPQEKSGKIFNQYDIVRLTASTGTHLNKRLFLGGLDALLSRATQELDELPRFSETESSPSTIRYLKDRTRQLPQDSHLDFSSANGIYYREIFFHIPYLLAQCLGSAQKFGDAKRWFEYIYDPTGGAHYWKYLPFLTDDIQALIESAAALLEDIKGNMPTNFEPDLQGLLSKLTPLVPVFQGMSPAVEAADTSLEFLRVAHENKDKNTGSKDSPYQLVRLLQAQTLPADPVLKQKVQSLIEILDIVGDLQPRWQSLNDSMEAQIKAYLDDPFDPHAIAKVRPLAYRKAVVMAYMDNLINWGDMLFRQYTLESINEARMLYVLAYDLLGKKPENLGRHRLSEDLSYATQSADLNKTAGYDFLLNLTNESLNLSVSGSPLARAALHTQRSITDQPYFYVPDNYQFMDYWNRVEDRLYKIRHSLNILGVKQPLPLFEPPIDPMALVRAVAGGMSIGGALNARTAAVPHYRFSFMLNMAKDLTGQLSQLGDALLGTLEKRDSEELNLLQSRQEAVLLKMSRNIKIAQLESARKSTAQLQESLANAQYRQKHFEDLIDEGILPLEKGQMAIIGIGGGLMTASAILKVASSIASAAPDAHLGPFIMGASYGGDRISGILENAAEALETGGDGISMFAEIPGIIAGVERMKTDWGLEVALAKSEIRQLGFQIEAAVIQERMAEYEINQLEKEIDHNTAVADFMRDKFTNAQLYQWMAGRLSGLYSRTYEMALDLARQAEKAFQFERGIKESAVSYIQPAYWDSQRQGLMAGQHLAHDLARMEAEFVRTDQRRLEIDKPISLLELNPLAWLELKTKGVCEFSLNEDLFDYDFPGHYCRQIREINLTFDIEPGLHRTVFATLTQLSHQTVMEPDAKAVKYLLDPKDQPPLSIRSDWRSGQQMAISRLKEDNGILDPFPDKERYMNFEGTGAVSRWRLELNGKKGDVDLSLLEDVVIHLQYAALNGGRAFAEQVRGLLKPYPATILLDVEMTFPDEWAAFLDGETEDLVIHLTRALFPNMEGGKISNIYTYIDLTEPAKAHFVLNNNDELTLKHDSALIPNALNIGTRGAEWTLRFNGDRALLQNLTLVLGYRAAVK